MTFNPLDAKTWHDDPKDAVIPPHEVRWHDSALYRMLYSAGEERALQLGDAVMISNKSSQFFGCFGTVLFVRKDGAIVHLILEEGNPLCDELHFHLDELTRRNVPALPPEPKDPLAQLFVDDPAPTQAALDSVFEALGCTGIPDARHVMSYEAAHQAYEDHFDAIIRSMRQLAGETGFLARDEAAEGMFAAFLQRAEGRTRSGPPEDEALIREADEWTDRMLEDARSDPPNTP